MDCRFLKQFMLVISVAALTITPSYSITHEILYSICSQTQNEETCIQVLESDPRTRSSTLPQLSLISINLTRKQAQENHLVFTSLRNNATSPSLKVAYERCRTLYKQMLSNINVAYQLAKQGKYKDIDQLGKAQDFAYKCENGVPPESKTAGYTMKMLITCQSSASVNAFIASQPPARS
ncbi:OLC1v1002106C1 [Oldenlandia corymbosa var. corymbosa]|uniref:OLC1v1002106C1 n=1 Tax=Oldenlandia corymbosa var. corymbosa TaxID=529605 RepID=A0AAV1D7K1_OLDCO|nr:OLC1v1002106C1 [Oldenlandia corymbosa var. corymbosa]